MPELPAGTVTFLFTDVEGSTRLLRELGDAYADVLAEHRRVLRKAFERHGGVEVGTEGDSFFVAFARASEALVAAREAQACLTGRIRVRMGLHTGEPLIREVGYVGIDVHRAARIAAAGHGGQILVSQSTRDLVDADDVQDLGEHRLKDLTAPERIYQLGDGSFPPLKSLNQSNLPVQPTVLIGRERELADVVELVRSRSLVTLTGAGGSGKTRLALQAAVELVDEFDDGVWFVSLAALTDAALLEPTIASAIGARDELAEFIGNKQMLIVLDNFEQLVAGASKISSLLGSAAGMKLLVTSRTPLELAGENEHVVPPLPQSEAMELFVQRARAVKQDFELTDLTAPVVAEICERLDGLPLAVELAAARTRVLAPEALLRRLEQRLGLLVGGARDSPMRQQTLRGAIDWSYRLLDDREQSLFIRLAVFDGGCRLDAAEAVCDHDDDLRLDVLDGLTSLVKQSLLRQESDPDDEPRFWMLETIKEYAREHLAESPDAEAVADAHVRHYANLAARAEELLHGEEEAAGSARLESERDNFRAALRRLRRQGEDARFAAFAASLGRFWAQRFHLREGAEWLDRALELPGVDPAIRETALKYAFWIAYFSSDLVKARGLGEERARNAECVDDIAIQGAQSTLAHIAEMENDNERACALQEKAVETARRIGDPRVISAAVMNLGTMRERLGRHAGARRCVEEALEIDRALGERGDVARDLANLGWIAIRQGHLDEAVAAFLESLGPILEFDYRELMVDALGGLAAVSLVKGDVARAAVLAGAEEALVEAAEVVLSSFAQATRERYFRAPLREMDDSEVDAAWDVGRSMSYEEIAAYAADTPLVAS